MALKAIVEKPFARITYTEAIQTIQQDLKDKKMKLKVRPKFGDDLGSEHEHYLVSKYGPVFVYNWEKNIKSFYMKDNGDGTCECFDLLMPHVGELIGGSQREDDLGKLETRIAEKKIDPTPLEFYLDLRRYGTCPHGGFGLGIDRLLMMLTGMVNIRDVIPFPVYYSSCRY